MPRVSDDETAGQDVFRVPGGYEKALRDAVSVRCYEPRRLFSMSDPEWDAYRRDSGRRQAGLEHELRGAPVVVPRWVALGFSPERYPPSAPDWLEASDDVEVHADDSLHPVPAEMGAAS